MAEISVSNFAESVGAPVEKIMEQMIKAGIKVESADTLINDEQKKQLLDFLRGQHGSENKVKKITLKRKTTSEIRRTGNKSVVVEVRKKRSFTKPGAKSSSDDTSQEESTETVKDTSEQRQLSDEEIALAKKREQERELIRLRKKEIANYH